MGNPFLIFKKDVDNLLKFNYYYKMAQKETLIF
jgi:hypothetical protein